MQGVFIVNFLPSSLFQLQFKLQSKKMKIIILSFFSLFLYSCDEAIATDQLNKIESNDIIEKCSKDLLSDFRMIQVQCRETYTEQERENCINLVDEFNEIYPPYFECKAADKSGVEDKIVILSTEKMMRIREQLERRDIP